MAGSQRSRISSGAELIAAAAMTLPNHVDTSPARPSSSAMTAASTGRHPTPAQLLVDQQARPVHRGEIRDGILLPASGEKVARRLPAAGRGRRLIVDGPHGPLAPAEQLISVVAHDPLLGGVVERVQQLDEVGRLGQAFGVRIVGAHQQTFVVP